ncbi:HIG1 domain-containing protein [Sphingomonas abietis]|uniref:HIG1 domain-containing protein n=1 Tax=Sphingomonas abietis TaxID=3012344 RepID=A0ABY7NRU0_9SPHN|nr:HIG1 domain-containing protein [Sphingomonas abietis]WBO22679.1 HIG1 domain-containing protein [Sphingomonas abietis]
MQTVLAIIVLLFALAALVALMRGIVMFLRTKSEELRGDPSAGPSPSSLRQNRMMWRRIQFQALAVIAAVLFLLLAHPHGH